MTHMEREWAVGRRLAPLEKLDKALPGFMATGAAVLTRAGSFRGMQHTTQLCLTTLCNYAYHMQHMAMHHLFLMPIYSIYSSALPHHCLQPCMPCNRRKACKRVSS